MDFQSRLDKYLLTRAVHWRLTLDQWEDQQLEQLLKSVDQAKNEIISEFEERLKSGRHAPWTEARMKSVLDELQDMTLGIKEQLGQDLDDIGMTAAVKSIEEHSDIMSFDGTLAGFNNVELSPEQLRAMVEAPLGGLQAAEVVANAFDNNLIDRVKADVDAGLLKGESYQKLVKRVSDHWGGARNDIISITRTQVQQVNNDASWKVADANRDILKDTWTWSSILDTRTCIRCAFLDGKEFELDDPIPIPRHIRCRCIRHWNTKSFRELGIDIPEIEPAMRNWVLRDGQVGVGGATAEVMGKWSGNFGSWFDELPYKRQVEIVGPTRAKLIKEGKIKFEDLADSRGRVYALNKGRTGLADEKWADVDVGSGAKAKFSFVSSLEQAKDSARSIGIKDVVYGASDTRTQWRDFERLFGEPLDAQDAIDLSNRILPEAYDLKNRFPDIPLYGIDELWLRGGGRGRAIHGWSNDRVLMTGTDKLWDNDAIQRVKSWEKTNGRRWASMSIDNYENIIGSTFRHELGHILTTEKNAKKLVKIMEQENIDLDWFRENVSEYAGTNHHEAFAETFALYTSRNYEKGSLPKSIEDLMEDSLQGRVGEFGTESGDPFSSTVGQSVIPPESDDSKLAEDDNEFPSAVERDVKIIS